MSIREAIVTTLLIIVMGLFLGLLIRIKRQNISANDYLTAINLSVKFLIVYPFIIFPLIAYLTKESIAENIAKVTLKKDSKCINKNKKEIEKEILDNYTFMFIMKMWKVLLKGIILDYDDYIDENMELVKKIIVSRKKERKQMYERNLRYVNYKSYQKELIKNAEEKVLKKIAIC